MILEDGTMSKNNSEVTLKWRKDNLVRYELTLNKNTNAIAYKQFKKQKNKRDYLIKLIEKDAKK